MEEGMCLPVQCIDLLMTWAITDHHAVPVPAAEEAAAAGSSPPPVGAAALEALTQSHPPLSPAGKGRAKEGKGREGEGREGRARAWQ